MPPQPATPQSHSSDNINPHTQPQKAPQSSPTTQPKQQSPIETNTNLATQPSIPATETCESVSSSPSQHIPKSANGEGVKSSKPESRSNAPDGRLCFLCKQPGHLKKDCPEQPYCSKCRTRGHVPGRCLLNSRATSQITKDTNFERKQEGAMKLTEKSGKGRPINHSSHTKTTDVSTVLVITNLVIAPQDNNSRLPPLATLPVAQVFIKTPVNFQTLHHHIVHTHSNILNKANLLLVLPHLHSQSLTHNFHKIFNIRPQHQSHRSTNN